MGLRPTFYDFVLNDDSVVQVTRNYAGLYMLRAYDRDLYEESQIFNRKAPNKNSSVDDLEMAAVIYTAYVAACLMNNSTRKSRGEAEEEIMSEVEFLTKMPTSVGVIQNIYEKLFGDEKKKVTSQKHFSKQHG